MAFLHSLDALKQGDKLRWYFNDIYYSGGNPQVNLPNSDFPHYVAIPMEGINRPAITRFVEERLSQTVVWDWYRYSYWFAETGTYREGRQIENGWYVFYFQNPEEKALFTLEIRGCRDQPTWEDPSGEFTRPYPPSQDFLDRWKINN